MASEGTSYQIFETYYNQAKQAEDQGRMAQAKKLYLLASESLLMSAKLVSGELRASMVRRADRLVMLAQLIPLPAEQNAENTPPKGTSRVDSKREPVAAKQSDESETTWVHSAKPNVRFDDVAGLEDVKQSVRDRVILPRLHPEIYKAFDLDVGGGILLYGPPGTGKTMIAKAIATEIDAEFFAIRCSDIVGKYFGEAEKNIKNLFDTARAAGSSIIFFDEFEALASHRGGNSTVMNRLVPELLSQLDGFTVSDGNSLLFLASTNRPWDIDTAFLRPPRLTEKIYVGLPDSDARQYLIRKHIAPYPHNEDVDIAQIAMHTEGYNSADVVELCMTMKRNAVKHSIERKIEINDGQLCNICWDDALNALNRVRKSVQQKDVDAIQRWERAQNT